MTARKRTAATLLALAVPLAFATTAPAVTLMVNGDTPSVHWQRIVEGSSVPTVDRTVDLYLGSNACGPDEGACTDGLKAMWLRFDSEGDFFHELGHVFDATYLTDSDHAYYMRLWGPWPVLAAGHPAANWNDPDASTDETHYMLPAEHFAEVYSLCARLPSLGVLRTASFRPLANGGESLLSFEYGQLGHGGDERRFAGTVRHSCLLLRYVGSRESADMPSPHPRAGAHAPDPLSQQGR